ncbi:hypothetical protein [Actinoplanes sp. CA-252034]|uniref:hypothetical protein n=1 Tax=Actinoplanes sp. CA-252034 TaxID=3239906 RepID=UPI003D9690DE
MIPMLASHPRTPPSTWAPDQFHLPPYARRARQAAARTGSVTAAFAATFDEAGIAVRATGDDRWRDPAAGLLLVGDHRCRHEFITLCALLARTGRPSATLIAKPYSRAARILSMVGRHDPETVLPVIPRTLARDRAGIRTRDLLARLRHRDALPTTDELTALNRHTVTRASRLISTGRAVVVFPTGGIGNALTAPWYDGAARILGEADGSALVVLFRCARFSPRGLIRSLNRPGHGGARVIVDIHTMGSVLEVVRGRRSDPAGITRDLRDRFRSRLG